MKKPRNPCSWRSLRSLNRHDVVRIRGDYWVVFTIRAVGASHICIHVRRVAEQRTAPSSCLNIEGMVIQGHGSARILRRNSV